MKGKLIKLLVFVVVIITSFSHLSAQTKYTRAQMRKNPVWIEMMQDPQANFYETVEAFKVFWKGKELPREAWENQEGDAFERELGLEEGEEAEDRKEREREKEREKKKASNGEYMFEVKQFRGWYTDSKPWVQEDGHILTEAERQAIVDKQRAELQEVERKNTQK